jgi:hypothetical protein
LPAIYEQDFMARDGGLMSYGADATESFDRAGRWVKLRHAIANPAHPHPLTLPAVPPREYGKPGVKRNTAPASLDGRQIVDFPAKPGDEGKPERPARTQSRPRCRRFDETGTTSV